MDAMVILLVLVKVALVAIINVIAVMVLKAVVMDAQVAQIVLARKLMFAQRVIHHAIINAIVFIVVIVQAAIVAINVQIAKLAIHNVIQIINLFVRIYTHFQPDRCYHLYHYINNIQLSIHYS